MAIYVYMLRCADNSYYVGSATGDDLQPRIDQHNKRWPQALVFKAILRDAAQVRGSSGRRLRFAFRIIQSARTS
jgi:hypothetical protein